MLLNVRLDQFVSASRQAEKVARLICVNFAEEAKGEAAAHTLHTYLLKTKSTQETDDLVALAANFVERSKAAAAAKTTETAESAPESDAPVVDDSAQVSV